MIYTPSSSMLHHIPYIQNKETNPYTPRIIIATNETNKEDTHDDNNIHGKSERMESNNNNFNRLLIK